MDRIIGMGEYVISDAEAYIGGVISRSITMSILTGKLKSSHFQLIFKAGVRYDCEQTGS